MPPASIKQQFGGPAASPAAACNPRTRCIRLVAWSSGASWRPRCCWCVRGRVPPPRAFTAAAAAYFAGAPWRQLPRALWSRLASPHQCMPCHRRRAEQLASRPAQLGSWVRPITNRMAHLCATLVVCTTRQHPFPAAAPLLQALQRHQLGCVCPRGHSLRYVVTATVEPEGLPAPNTSCTPALVAAQQATASRAARAGCCHAATLPRCHAGPGLPAGRLLLERVTGWAAAAVDVQAVGLRKGKRGPV